MSPKPLHDYIVEGVLARENGKHATDNPYCVGSDERHEWTEGFRATVEKEDDGDLGLDPNDGSSVRPRGL